jgi:PhnB protein
MEQRATAMLSYEDVAAAADFAIEAFGFTQRGPRLTDDDGRVTHVELERDGAIVMFGWPGPTYRDPRSHARTCADAAAWLETPFVVDGVLVTVADVEAHRERAAARGAEIVRDLEDAPPGRLYTAADPAGHRWMFVQPPNEG